MVANIKTCCLLKSGFRSIGICFLAVDQVVCAFLLDSNIINGGYDPQNIQRRLFAAKTSCEIFLVNVCLLEDYSNLINKFQLFEHII